MDRTLLRNALPDRLETARLVLRAPLRSDAGAIARLANNRSIHAMTTLPHPYHEAEAIAFVETVARSEGEHAWIIVDGGHLVGVIGVHLLADGPPELGYWIGEPFWGRGYATEAARAVRDACAHAGTPVLGAQTRSENAASRAVLDKLGFALQTETIAGPGPHHGVQVANYRWLAESAR